MDILLVNKINSAADKLIIIDRRVFKNIKVEIKLNTAKLCLKK